MARSFYRPRPENTVEDYTRKNSYYHKPSDSYFTMLRRDGKYYQRRHQIGFGGKQTNIEEKEISFVMGSGNHVRTYLNRDMRGMLVELPLAWYAAQGGYWAMNPGYDKPDHPGFRRRISYDCMFCHNAYSEIPAGHEAPGAVPLFPDALPEGIDCQRCHGPGSQHIQSPQRNTVNPTRLSADRQMEVCMQCHLETTSFRLPNSIKRYERGPFSYRPGEPLGDFMLFFDHAPGAGKDDKFEIVSSAYRLRKSACFLKSNGAMRCTTCHNPHDIPRGEKAAEHYNGVCRQCHGAAFERSLAAGKHTTATDCVSCHMPKRRTDDVVHAVMTDHYIQRQRPPRDLLAQIAERQETEANAYHGTVVPYYPSRLPQTPENELYLAVAQVSQKSNLSNGIAQLTTAIEKLQPQRGEFYLELADALHNNGELDKAIPFYEECVRRNPGLLAGLRKLGAALNESGQHARAVEILKRATELSPEDSASWEELGATYQQLSQKPDAMAALQKAVVLDPDLAEAHNNLGGLWLDRGDRGRAEVSFREAIRIQPDYGQAHYNYGAMLVGMQRFDEAGRQMQAAIRLDPGIPEAHEVFGSLLERKGQMDTALREYAEAVRLRPDFARAHLDLGVVLIKKGDMNGAVPHLRQAAGSADAGVRQLATEILAQLGGGR
jgi:predicted CXXCH cytochrome family protein